MSQTKRLFKNVFVVSRSSFSKSADDLIRASFVCFLLFGSKLGFGRILVHFAERFGDVHAFGYNSAESEPI